jgi:hypothetical protein
MLKAKQCCPYLDKLDRSGMLIIDKVDRKVTIQSRLSWLGLMKNLNWSLWQKREKDFLRSYEDDLTLLLSWWEHWVFEKEKEKKVHDIIREEFWWRKTLIL